MAGWFYFFFFTPPLLHEFQPALKLFKPLFYLLYVCVCVHQGREGAGGILPPIPSSFQFCSPAFSSKARSYLLPPSILLFHGCLVGQLFCHAFPLANQSCQPPAPFQKYSRLQPKPSRSSALRHGWQGAFWKQPPQFLPDAVPLLPHLIRLLRSGGRGEIPKHNSSPGRNASVLEPAVASPLPKAVRMAAA